VWTSAHSQLTSHPLNQSLANTIGKGWTNSVIYKLWLTDCISVWSVQPTRPSIVLRPSQWSPVSCVSQSVDETNMTWPRPKCSVGAQVFHVPRDLLINWHKWWSYWTGRRSGIQWWLHWARLVESTPSWNELLHAQPPTVTWEDQKLHSQHSKKRLNKQRMNEWAWFNVCTNTILVIQPTVFTGLMTQPTVSESKHWRRVVKSSRQASV